MLNFRSGERKFRSRERLKFYFKIFKSGLLVDRSPIDPTIFIVVASGINPVLDVFKIKQR